MTMDRRRFLSTTALGSLGAVCAAGTARAFSIEPATVEQQAHFLDACGRNRYHDALIAEIRQKLDGRISEEEIAQAVAAVRCPLCGCAPS